MNDREDVNRIKDSSQGGAEMLEAFFDNELSAEDRHTVQHQLESDSLLKHDYESLKTIRRELRGWLDDQLTAPDGQPLRANLWEKIEQRLADEPVRRPVRYRVFQAVGEYTAGIFESWARPQVLGPAFAVLCLAFYAGYNLGSGARPDGMQLVNGPIVNDPERLVQLQVPAAEAGLGMGAAASAPAHSQPGSLFALVHDAEIGEMGRAAGTVGRPGDQSVRLVVANSDVVAKDVPRFERRIPLVHRTLQRFKRGPVPGGLRAGGLDIDWIDTDRRFRIVPSDNAGVPPVIWLMQDSAR